MSDLSKLQNLVNNNTKVNSNTNSEYDYSLIYAAIKKGIINPQTMPLKSYNWIFSEISKMSLTEFLAYKANSDYKKKIRRFFQLLGGKNVTDEKNKELRSEYFATIRELLNEKPEKETTKETGKVK